MANIGGGVAATAIIRTDELPILGNLDESIEECFRRIPVCLDLWSEGNHCRKHRPGSQAVVRADRYWRFLPNAFVLEEFMSQHNPKVLDASSPKLLSLMLASRTENEVYATDLDDAVIFSRWQPLAGALGLKNYKVEFQDVRQLKYPDDFFDLVYSDQRDRAYPGAG